MKNKVLILHYEFYKNYLNKNIGYFIDSAISNGYKVDFLTLSSAIHENVTKENFSLLKINSSNFESLELYRYLFNNRKQYKFVWLYPSYRWFVFLLLFLRICGIKTIIKTDSHEVANNKAYTFRGLRQFIRKKLIVLLSYKIIVENKSLLEFYKSNKTYQYSLGLPQKNLEMIEKLLYDIKKEKTILYIGRINYAKGLDRLIDIFESLLIQNKIDKDYKLKIVGKILEKEYYKKLIKKVETSKVLDKKIFFESEKSGEDYYKEILKASLVVLPTRNEGLPNILADCFFCKTLFLTTTGAKANDIIKDTNFFCKNDDESLLPAIYEVITNIEYYQKNIDNFYDKSFFIKANNFFEEILND